MPNTPLTPLPSNQHTIPSPQRKNTLYGQDKRLAIVPDAFCPKHTIYRLLPFWVSFVEHTIVLM